MVPSRLTRIKEEKTEITAPLLWTAVMFGEVVSAQQKSIENEAYSVSNRLFLCGISLKYISDPTGRSLIFSNEVGGGYSDECSSRGMLDWFNFGKAIFQMWD